MAGTWEEKVSNGPEHNSVGQAMLPQRQAGIILRKFFDQSQGVWVLGLGARTVDRHTGKVVETVIGLSFAEAETVVRGMIGILDSFTPDQRIVRRPL